MVRVRWVGARAVAWGAHIRPSRPKPCSKATTPALSRAPVSTTCSMRRRGSGGGQGALDGRVQLARAQRLEEAAGDAESGQAGLVVVAEPPARDEEHGHRGVQRAEAFHELPPV